MKGSNVRLGRLGHNRSLPTAATGLPSTPHKDKLFIPENMAQLEGFWCQGQHRIGAWYLQGVCTRRRVLLAWDGLGLASTSVDAIRSALQTHKLMPWTRGCGPPPRPVRQRSHTTCTPTHPHTHTHTPTHTHTHPHTPTHPHPHPPTPTPTHTHTHPPTHTHTR